MVGEQEQSETGGANFKRPKGMQTGEFARLVAKDPIIARIEARIARATGIPVHQHEDMVALAKITSWGTTPRNGNFV